MARKNKPERVFKIGRCTASVFAHHVETAGTNRILRSVNIQKRYMDGDEAKYTTSFNLSELPQAIRVLTMAQEYVEVQEAIVSSEP